MGHVSRAGGESNLAIHVFSTKILEDGVYGPEE